MSTRTASPHGAVEIDRTPSEADPNHISQTATTTAILFPGQGSQTSEMRELVARERPDLLQAAIDQVGEDPFPRADDGTNFAQPAIFCASLAGWASIGSPVAELLAGHSLGELGALVAAEAIDERDALALVTLRGKLMYESGLAAGDGSMVAVMGAGAAEHAQEIADASKLTVANDNSPMQIVLSGAKAQIPAALESAKGLGLRAMELDVTGAFHSPMMAAAVPEFERALADVEFREPVTTVISAVTARPFADPRRELADALTQPVRWREVMLAMHQLGARRFVDVGPGRVLTGLAKRTLKDVELVNA
ncbi:MAG: ACP S-malonyltransferase [Solirubrobacteraceae bacterium]